ncbi:SDR family NAD(P)-dependent oxidoreductase [Agrilactobacillus fermenti]|uniref:SDR family NAD(P)-dependent oxidoreductase n=1 Tax=Agrilactobacillus fermenti TaxID=2586909 RepID=UPI001E341B2F|nr:SDR family oxidoreductase [Agrilactobacillus fermenti]MCD2255689.1 SDR family oxidoreductase [Agrilactobacillus fermenti]
MKFDFKHKVALITGGASGIGLAVVSNYIDAGGQVVVADLNQQRLAELTEKYGTDTFLGVPTDVSNEAQVNHAVEAGVQKFGHLDNAFLVAGANKLGPLLDQSMADYDFVLNIDLRGVVMFIKAFGRQIRTQATPGTIVNIASINALVPEPLGSAYSIAKAGVQMATQSASLELAPFNIRTNAILPGLVNTPLTESMRENPEINAEMMKNIPFKRGADPSEIAQVALFLSDDASSYVNGASIVVDAGATSATYPDLSQLFK